MMNFDMILSLITIYIDTTLLTLVMLVAMGL